MSTERGKAFAELTHRLLTMQGSGTIGEVAERMGMARDLLYARLYNRICFSADEINRLLQAVPDARLLDPLLDDTPFIAADRRAVADQGGMPDVHHGATHSVLQAADVLRAVEEALTDRMLDHRDRARIEAEIDEAERALASLRVCLQHR